MKYTLDIFDDFYEDPKLKEKSEELDKWADEVMYKIGEGITNLVPKRKTYESTGNKTR